jgi:hypothetical protein
VQAGVASNEESHVAKSTVDDLWIISIDKRAGRGGCGGFGLGAWRLEFGLRDLGYRVCGSGFEVRGLGIGVWVGLWASGLKAWG